MIEVSAKLIVDMTSMPLLPKALAETHGEDAKSVESSNEDTLKAVLADALEGGAGRGDSIDRVLALLEGGSGTRRPCAFAASQRADDARAGGWIHAWRWP